MKYVVKTLSMSGRGNKIHRNGETVTAENFPNENVNELVKHGFIVPLEDSEAPEKAPIEDNEQVANDSNESTKSEPKLYPEITVKELREITGENDQSLKKADLYDIYLQTF